MKKKNNDPDSINNDQRGGLINSVTPSSSSESEKSNEMEAIPNFLYANIPSELQNKAEEDSKNGSNNSKNRKRKTLNDTYSIIDNIPNIMGRRKTKSEYRKIPTGLKLANFVDIHNPNISK